MKIIRHRNTSHKIKENANKKVVDYKIYEFPIFLSLQNKLLKEKLQHQKRRLRRRRPIVRWKKCNPVRKKKRQL